MPCIDMRLGFDYYKSVADIEKLKDQVAEMDVKYFEETEIAKKRFWEEAFYQYIFILMLTVQDAGRVKDIAKNDKKNPKITEIVEKLYKLVNEVKDLIDEINEDTKISAGCMGNGDSFRLHGKNARERREGHVKKLKACFGEG